MKKFQKRIENEMKKFLRENFKNYAFLGGEICNFKTSVSCHKLVADFRFLMSFRNLILSSHKISSTEKNPGSLLKMLLTQMEDDPDLQRAVFLHYVSNKTNAKLFAKHWLQNDDEVDDNLPLHDLIALLANRDDGFDRSSSVFGQQVIIFPKESIKIVYFWRKM